MKCISISIPYHGIKTDAGMPVGGPIISWPWNGDASATPYERYTTWGDDGPYSYNTTFVWREKIDIRGLTQQMDKTVFPVKVDLERPMTHEDVEANPAEFIDTFILSRTPISDDDLQRIPADTDGFGGGMMPGMYGTDTDSADVIYWNQTLYAHNTNVTTPIWDERVYTGGRMKPLASGNMWVYRIIQTRWNSAGFSNGATLLPAINAYLHIDDVKEDVVPYLSRLAMSVKTTQ